MTTQTTFAGILFLAGVCSAASWGYHGDTGPETWGQSYEECNGNSQSPIDILTDNAEIDYSLPIVDRMLFYDPPKRMQISNNGHSLVMTFEKGEYVIKKGDLLPFDAQIVQAHFHWGKSATMPGSEHTINGKQYFGELHAVHYNTKYANISEAVAKPDGLAVFGWFIDATYPQPNQAMRNVFRLAKSVRYSGRSKYVTPFSLESIIPANLDMYYRYNGSLTTPGCHESVTWTVFKEPIQIAARQTQYLAKKLFEDKKGESLEPTTIQENFRPVQPLNGRKITRPAPMVRQTEPNTTTL